MAAMLTGIMRGDTGIIRRDVPFGCVCYLSKVTYLCYKWCGDYGCCKESFWDVKFQGFNIVSIGCMSELLVCNKHSLKLVL